MLLGLLSREEKIHFIDMLGKIIVVDGPTNELETQIINKLKHEMGDDVAKYRKTNLSLEKLIEYFAEKPKTIKNLVFLNIVSASLYDDFYSVEEHIVIEKIQEQFGISNKKKQELVKVVYAERDLREKAKRVISEWLFKNHIPLLQNYI